MKVGAHPLVVAVALGMLSPAALAAADGEACEGERARTTAPCDGCDCGRTDAPADAPAQEAAAPLAHAFGEMLR
ncbi:MAG: hypothetical protein H6732_03675 [Alphaproteobacteria bacterium]|nr:hypothetical protein [Alphaproteobacteria bacterium]